MIQLLSCLTSFLKREEKVIKRGSMRSSNLKLFFSLIVQFIFTVACLDHFFPEIPDWAFVMYSAIYSTMIFHFLGLYE